MDSIRHLVRQESNFNVSDGTIDLMVGNMDELEVPARTAIIRAGEINTNVYLVLRGILKMSYLYDAKEVTYGFGGPGSFFISPHAFYMNRPAFMQVETCKTSATVLCMKRERFYGLMSSSHEFAEWMFHISIHQLLACEMKLSVINGTAKERYVSLLKNRPEILKYISKKNIASYLGVTPEYLSRISVDV